MNVTLPFNTPEEKKAVFAQAKEGDPVATAFLRQRYSLAVWTQEEIDALNLLLDSGTENETVRHFNVLREESERCNRFRKKDKGGE